MVQPISPWQTLGIAATQDERMIKRAYARQLKTTRPDECPAQFQTLRQAYELALQLAKQAAHENAVEHIAENGDARETGSEQAGDATAAAPQPEPPPVTEAPEPTSTALAAGVGPDPQSRGNQPAIDPRQLARQQLEQLLGMKNYEVTAHLKELLESDALLSLEQRDAFELAAFAYCGQPDAAENMVKLFFTTFDWENHLGYLARMDQALLHQVLQRRHEVNVVQHARRLWRDLFAAGVNHAEQVFQLMMKDGALNNHAVNLAFQQHAIRYCAGVNVNHELAATLIKAFEWGYDVSHLDHEHQLLVKQVLLQHRTWCDWMQLQGEAMRIPELGLLLGQKMPGPSWSLWDKGAARKMQNWVTTLREKYPALLQNNVNRHVFEAWAKKVDAKRYFLQTFLHSLLWGIPFAAFWAVLFILPSADPLNEDLPLLWLLLAGEASSVITIAWLALRPPGRLTGWWQRCRTTLLSRLPWFSSQQANAASIALFGLYALCLLPPSYGHFLPPGWQAPFLWLDLGLLVLLLARDVPVLKLCLALFAGAVLVAKAIVPGMPPATGGLLLLLLLMLCRGSKALERLYQPQRLQRARRIWLFCALLLFMLRALVIATENLVALTHPLSILALGCLCLAGLQLGEFYLHGRTFFWLFGTLFSAAVLIATLKPPRLMPELTVLITLSNYLAVVIVANLIQTSEHPDLKRSTSFT